jgi:DNA-nicking Smr family endonuclease
MAQLDLHGHTVDEALGVFIDVYNRHIRSRSKESLRVIHGYG